MIYSFGTCRVNTARMLLERDGAPVHVEPQVFELLCLLIECRGRAVTKDEIFERIWENRAISDAVLTTRIRSLRRAIDDVGGASLIRTVHRIGYEFLPKVTVLEELASAEPHASSIADRQPRKVSEELRQAVVIAFQPRLALDRPFDPERLDRLVLTVYRQLAERIDTDGDELLEGTEGTIYALLGAKIARDNDIERAAGLALDFAGTASGGDAKLAVAIAKGKIARSGASYRGTAMLRSIQAVGLARSGEVYLSPEIVDQMPGHARMETAQEGMARLVGLQAPLPQVHSSTPFVGRLVEVGLIQSAVEAMIENKSGGCITLEGVAGVGKSRLANRAVDMVVDAGGYASHVFVRELSADGVLHRNVFKGFLEAARAATAAHSRIAPDAARVLDRILDGSIGRNAVQHTEKLGDAIISLLSRITEEVPILIVIEDAHWIDLESRDLALELAAICSQMQAILLVTSRPSSRDFLDEVAEQAQGDIVALSLAPLSGRQSAELIQTLAPELNEAETDLLVQRAGGNPLFITRLVEAYCAKGARSLEYVPGTIQSVVQVQFDQLNSSERDLLRQLSILGERFEIAVAETVYDDKALSLATTPGFLRRSGRWYQFTHNLVRESIYLTLPQHERRRLHTEAAKALVTYDPLLAAEHAMLGDLDQAASICVKVARDTFHFRRHGRSVALIEQATKLKCTPDQRAQLEIFLGSAAVDLGNEDKAMSHYENGVEWAQTSLPAVFALVRIARLHTRHYRSEEAHAALDQAAQWVAHDPGPGYLASEIAEARSVIAWINRQTAIAIEEGERACDLSDHPHATGRALKTLGWAYFSSARFQDADRCGQTCLDLIKEKNVRLIEPDILAPALRFRWYSDPSEARLEDANNAVHRAESIGIRLSRIQTRVVRMEIAWELEEWSLFEQDGEAVEAEILEADYLSFATMRFFQALRGDSGKPVPAVEPTARSFAFRPLELVSNLANSGRENQSASPLEQLWIARIKGEMQTAHLPETERDQSANWRNWASNKRVL